MALTHQTTVDNFIPEVWSKITRDTYEKNLILAPLMDRTFEQEFAGQPYDTVHVNGVDDFGTADQFSSGDDPITFEAGQYLAQIDIAINRHFYKAFALQHDAELFSNVDQMAKLSSKAAYAVALELDTYLAGFPDGLTSNVVGALGENVADDDIIEATRLLNANNVPFDQRVFVFSEDQDAEFKKVEKYTNADYARAVGNIDTGHTNGLVANIHGLDWYMTTNVEGSAATGHDNVIFQKEWLALNEIEQMRVEGPMYDLESDSDEYVVHKYYGAKQIRETSAVWVKGK